MVVVVLFIYLLLLLFFCCDRCLKEEVGMAEVGRWSWLGPVVGSWLGCWSLEIASVWVR